MIDSHPAHGRYSLRDLIDEDEQWLWPAHLEAMRPWIEPLFGWEEEAVRIFFEKSWRRRRIVMVGGENAGWLEVAVEHRWLFLHEIGLLPSYRNRGLGTQIINDILALADAKGLAVELQVLVTNPARRLYERMGFEPTHVKMHRKANK